MLRIDPQRFPIASAPDIAFGLKRAMPRSLSDRDRMDSAAPLADNTNPAFARLWSNYDVVEVVAGLAHRGRGLHRLPSDFFWLYATLANQGDAQFALNCLFDICNIHQPDGEAVALPPPQKNIPSTPAAGFWRKKT